MVGIGNHETGQPRPMSRPPRVIVPLSRRRRSLAPDKHALANAIGILLILAGIGITIASTYRSVLNQRSETEIRANLLLTNQTLALSEEIERQFLAVDQTLRGMARAWEENPQTFDLERRRADASVLSGLSRDMLLVDENGIVGQASVPEAIGQNVATRDFVAYARKQATPPGGVLFSREHIDMHTKTSRMLSQTHKHHPLLLRAAQEREALPSR